MTDDIIDLDEDSDDSIIISGFKVNNSLNRINIMTMNDSFQKSDKDGSLNHTGSSFGYNARFASKSPSDSEKENMNINNTPNLLNSENVVKEDQECGTKKNDISDYSSKNKSYILSKDESSSFLGMSDEIITIEDTYKETEQREVERS